LEYLRGAKHRRAVGTIVGAAFFLLILAQAITLLYMFMRENYSLNEVYNEANKLDQQKIQENIELINIVPTTDGYLNVSLRNTGQINSRIKYIEEIDESNILNKPVYYSIDYTIKIGEKATNIAGNLLSYSAGDQEKILFMTEVGNIFTFKYPLPAGSGENPTGNSLVTITGLNSSTYHPISFNLLGSTTHLGGTINDLVSDDGNYLSFGSYSGGIGVDETHYVDTVSDVDGSADKGTHSDFVALQAGPDLVSDSLTEENITPYNTTLINNESFEGTWPPTGWSETPTDNRWNKENDRAYSGSYSADFDGNPTQGTGNLETSTMDCSGSDVIYVDFWYRDEGCNNGEFLLEYYDGSSWNTVADLGSTTNENQWLHYQQRLTDPSYLNSAFKVRWAANGIGNQGHAYVDSVTVKKGVLTNYELDLESQFTGVDFTQSNEVLSIYLESGSSEPLMVDVWDGLSWNNLFPSLSVGWNNVSVSSYLTSSTLTLRFKDSYETNDKQQNVWRVDAVLLHLWSDSDQQVIDVEFLGGSNTYNWETLFWRIDNNYNDSSIPVSLSIYDYRSGSYPSNGDGYIGYVSQTPDVDELKNQTINVDLTRFRDSSGNWKMHLYAYKISNTTFRLNLDLLELKTTYTIQGSNIPYNTWREYIIKAVTAEGKPVSYGYASIYHNGTVVDIRDASTKTALSNPDWVYLDKYGEYHLELRSSNLVGETFTLSVTVGDTIGDKTITQSN
jgi:hypothetical protein